MTKSTLLFFFFQNIKRSLAENVCKPAHKILKRVMWQYKIYQHISRKI